MSLRPSSGLPRICSGLMNSGVPSTMPVASAWPRRPRPAAPWPARNPSPRPGARSRRGPVRHQHDVLGLEVPVNDVELVGMLRAPGISATSSGTPSATGNGPAPGLVLAERLPLEIRHHQVDQPSPVSPSPEDGADVGMVEPHGDRRLAPQPLDRGRIPRQPGRADLDRHRRRRSPCPRPGRRRTSRPRPAAVRPGSADRAACRSAWCSGSLLRAMRSSVGGHSGSGDRRTVRASGRVRSAGRAAG